MSKITNIGALDIRGINEEVAKKVSEIENIGILIEDDRSQLLLKDAKKVNIGSTVKLPSNEEVNLIIHNGKMKIDTEYLEGIINKIIILINGRLVFEKDIEPNLLNEKIHSIILNGELICPKKLSGLIQSKGTINGALTSYSTGYTFFNENIKLTNKFLKGIRKDSKLSFKNLIILEPLDLKLLEEKISNIEILKKLVVLEEYEDEMLQYIDDFYSVNKVIIPTSEFEVKYINEETNIDDSSIKKYSGNLVYIDDEVEINLSEQIDFGKYIKHLICEKIVCNEKTYEIIKNNIGKNIEIDIIQGKLLKNSTKLVLTGKIEEEITIRNMGKLVLDEELDYDSFIKNVIYIENFGSIKVPEEKISLVKAKVKKNFGVIKSDKEAEEKKTEKEENILYANMGELKL